MHTHAVAVTHIWSGFSCTNLPSNTLYKLAHTRRHTHTRTSWPWLSVVSRSADTWKDTLERGPFHSNSAQQHLARTRCFTPTVVKGMRVLNSMAAHSSLPTEWGKKSLSWTQHSIGWTLTHTPKQSLTRRPLRVRDLKFEWKNKWELAMSVKYFWLCSDGSHSKRWSSAATTEWTHEKSQCTHTDKETKIQCLSKLLGPPRNCQNSFGAPWNNLQQSATIYWRDEQLCFKGYSLFWCFGDGEGHCLSPCSDRHEHCVKKCSPLTHLNETFALASLALQSADKYSHKRKNKIKTKHEQ